MFLANYPLLDQSKHCDNCCCYTPHVEGIEITEKGLIHSWLCRICGETHVNECSCRPDNPFEAINRKLEDIMNLLEDKMS